MTVGDVDFERQSVTVRPKKNNDMAEKTLKQILGTRGAKEAENKELKDVYEKAKKKIRELAMRAEATTEKGYARAEGIINWLDQTLKGR